MARTILLPDNFKVSDFKKEWKELRQIRDQLNHGYGVTDDWLYNQFEDLGFELKSGKIFPKNLKTYRGHLDKAWRVVRKLQKELEARGLNPRLTLALVSKKVIRRKK